MLPVPITVTAERVKVLVADTVVSQPPEWLVVVSLRFLAGVGWSKS